MSKITIVSKLGFVAGWICFLAAVNPMLLHAQESNRTEESMAREEGEATDASKLFRWFTEPRKNQDGKVSEDYISRAWVEMMQRRAANEGRTFSISEPMKGSRTTGSYVNPDGLTTQSADNTSSILTWNNIGPRNASYSGRIGVNAIAVHPTNTNIMYVGGGTGGVWKTIDGGGSWTSLTDKLPSQACGSLAIDPVNPNTIYYGTGDAFVPGGSMGIFKSTDGGANWSLIATQSQVGYNVLKIIVDPTNTQRIFSLSSSATPNGGVYRSLNGGTSWTKLINASQVRDILFSPTNSNIVIAGIGGSPGYQTSAGIYKSTNGGDSWRKIKSGLPDSSLVGRTQLAISQSSPNILYAITGKSLDGDLLGMYKSTDGGENWSQLNTVASIFRVHGWLYCNSITIHPTNPNILFVGNAEIYRSTDAGASWASISGGVHPDHQCFKWAGTSLVAGTDGGPYKSSDNGTTWMNINSNLVLTQFRPGISVDRQNKAVWGGSQDNGAYRVSSAGSIQNLVTDAYATAVDPSNPNYVYTLINRPYRTSDGGETWTSNGAGITDWGPATALIVVDPVSPNIVYFTTSSFYKSTNRGDSWTALSALPFSGNWMAVNPANTNVIYVAGAGGHLLKSTNGGSSWSVIFTHPTGITFSQVVLDPTSPSTVYASALSMGSADHMWKSTDAGSTWTNINGDLPGVPVNAIRPDPRAQNMLYAGTDMGMFYSTNAGANWIHDDAFPNTIVNDIAMLDANTLVAATFGRGMYTAPLPSLVQPPTSVTVTSPNGWEIWVGGTTHTISWSQYAVSAVKLEYSVNNGSTWSIVTSSTPASSVSYPWIVPNTISTQALVRISDASNVATTDVSNATFTIVAGPSVTVTAPNGGEIWTGGTSHNIMWSQSGVANVRIEYSTNNGATWNTVSSSATASAGSYAWIVPNAPTTQGLVRVSDASNVSTKDVSNGMFSISGGTGVGVTSPNGGETWSPGTSHSISWSQSGLSYVKIEYSTNNGSIWNLVTSSVPAASGSYGWTVPNTLTTQALVRISDASNASINDVSNGMFSITAGKSVTVTSPNGGENWTAGSSRSMVWSQAGLTSVKIEYSSTGGSSWNLVTSSAPASSGSYPWIVPATLTTQALVRISDASNAATMDMSNGTFSISAAPIVTVTTPNGGENWIAGTTHAIAWTQTAVSSVNIKYSTNNGSTWNLVASNRPASPGNYAWLIPNTVTTQALIEISDASNVATKDVSNGTFVISPAPAVTVRSPDGGEIWIAGTSHDITWSQTAITDVRIEYSTNNGTSWSVVTSGSPASSGIYPWTLPQAVTSDALIRISDVSNAATRDMSNGAFTMGSSSLPATPSLSSPGNGSKDEWTTVILQWKSAVGALKYHLQVSTSSGFSTFVVNDSTLKELSYCMKSASYGTTYYWRVSARNNIGSSAPANARSFTTTAAPQAGVVVQVLEPTGGETWTVGSTQTIRWTSSGVSSLRLLYSTNAGINWTRIVDNFSASLGSYTWKVPSKPSKLSLVRMSNGSQPLGQCDSLFTISTQQSVQNGWNLLSAPARPLQSQASLVYPEAVSEPFTYLGGRYIAETEIDPGIGYWIKFPEERLIDFPGDGIEIETVAVARGWNMIGAISSPIARSSIIQDPPGIISSFIYGFQDGYQICDTLREGMGYWIKSSTAGRFILMMDTSTVAQPKTAMGWPNLDLFNSLTIRDAKGNGQTLYFGAKGSMTYPEDFFELPPIPPGDVFDARFSSGRAMELINGLATREFPITLTSPTYPLTITWRLIGTDGLRSSMIVDGERNLMDGDGALTILAAVSTVRLEVISDGLTEIPAEFKLLQNHPNPFNPFTVIRYQLPVKSHVTLNVYNVLGQQVKTLVDGTRDAGVESIEWDATSFPSGLYFYRLYATSLDDNRKSFIQIKEMVLLK